MRPHHSVYSQLNKSIYAGDGGFNNCSTFVGDALDPRYMYVPNLTLGILKFSVPIYKFVLF